MLREKPQLVICRWGQTTKIIMQPAIPKYKDNGKYSIFLMSLFWYYILHHYFLPSVLTSSWPAVATVIASPPYSRALSLVPFRTCWIAHTIQVFRCPNAIGRFTDCSTLVMALLGGGCPM
jgi:hypothetical protein